MFRNSTRGGGSPPPPPPMPPYDCDADGEQPASYLATGARSGRCRGGRQRGPLAAAARGAGQGRSAPAEGRSLHRDRLFALRRYPRVGRGSTAGSALFPNRPNLTAGRHALPKRGCCSVAGWCAVTHHTCRRGHKAWSKAHVDALPELRQGGTTPLLNCHDAARPASVPPVRCGPSFSAVKVRTRQALVRLRQGGRAGRQDGFRLAGPGIRAFESLTPRPRRLRGPRPGLTEPEGPSF